MGMMKQIATSKNSIHHENVESAKLRIVYDTSTREGSRNILLNDCLETGSALQNFLWSILIRTRFKPTVLSGDLQKVFLKIQIYKERS